MSDKLVSLEAVKRTLENAYYGEATLGELLETLDAISPVEQPMSAVEFVNIIQHLCINEFAADCKDCPLRSWHGYWECGLKTIRPEAVVELCEQWVREHPERSEE